ncbi:unnamed protein product [Lymnaea stagnalis]|uniref:Uncharacterized protein n=1 Tax=Lymnaea stagnalis TaxID=6523 RepID=A0AAV2HHJ0_LYMST
MIDARTEKETNPRAPPQADTSEALITVWDSTATGPPSCCDMNENSRRDEHKVSVSPASGDPVFGRDFGDPDASCKAGSDVVVLKYEKPWAERSPIKLSSDSENENEVKRESQHVKKQKDLDGEANANENALTSPSRRTLGGTLLNHPSGSADDVPPEENKVPRKRRLPPVSPDRKRNRKTQNTRPEGEAHLLFSGAVIPQTVQRRVDLVYKPHSSRATGCVLRLPDRRLELEKRKRATKRQEPRQERNVTIVTTDPPLVDDDSFFHIMLFLVALLTQCMVLFRLH